MCVHVRKWKRETKREKYLKELWEKNERESKYERNTSLNLDESKNFVCLSWSEIENELERKNTLYNYERSKNEWKRANLIGRKITS